MPDRTNVIYTHAAAALGGAALTAVLTWNIQGWRYGEQIADLKAAHSKETALNAARALDDYLRMEKTKDAAIKSANIRAEANKVAAAGARAAADGLRDDLASVPARISAASRAAVDQYATVAGGLLDHCAREYTDMAAKAQGHASDVRLMQEAWPK